MKCEIPTDETPTNHVSKKLSDNIAYALARVDKDFISHFSDESWGGAVLIMEKSGSAFARLYWYHDDNSTVYLDWLNVSESIRKQGMGTWMQEMREKMGLAMGADTACLWVKQDSWMYEWYKRRGYEYWQDNKQYEGAVWMKKVLNKER